MKWKRAVAVLLLCGLLQGCGLAPSFADPERSAGKIVLQVSVEAMPADTAWDRVYHGACENRGDPGLHPGAAYGPTGDR